MDDTPSLEALLERIRTLEEVAASYKTLVEASPDLIYRTDETGRISFISPSVLRLSGFTVEEAVGMNMAEEAYLVPEERDAFLAALSASGEVYEFEARLRRKDGSVWWAGTNAHWLKDASGKIIGVEGIARDISARKAAEAASKAADERFRSAFLTSPDAVNLNRLSDGVYIDINEGFTELTGYSREDVIGKSSFEVNIWSKTEDRARLVLALQNDGFVRNLEGEFTMKDGSVHVGLMSARLLHFDDEDVILSITRNISERKAAETARVKLEKQLAESQKMEAVGRLAGGIAHDLNNLLVPIFGYTEMLLMDTTALDPRRDKLAEVMKAARGAGDLIRQLLAFSRRQKLDYKAVNVNDVLLGFKNLLRRTIREDIDMALELSDEMLPVMADVGQLEQVLMNLVVNGAHAMPAGGRLVIQTSLEYWAEKGSELRPSAPPGQYVVLRVTDTGAGMDEETLAHIFEPFFSTKGDQGTGLGLATVYGIVKQHRGHIYVTSAEGRGSTFAVCLPTTDPAEQVEDVRKKSDAPRGTETILIVEDNGDVRTVVEHILKQQGYTVHAAEDGPTAVAMMRKSGEPLSLLVTDVIMPSMNGKELFLTLSAMYPKLKVLYMSGYTDDVILHHGGIGDDVHFIQKPFTKLSMSAKVREVLDIS